MILASTVKLTTMADDTVRLTIDIDPKYGDEACALFRLRGIPLVIARLTQEAATAHQQAETVAGDTDVAPNQDKPVGGPLARLAGQLCNDLNFRDWLREVTDALDVTHEEAAQYVRWKCKVDSRATLDHNHDAAERFHAYIRLPYLEWRKERGLA